jgi:branched-chain amino acid transport system substrate-binding protein
VGIANANVARMVIGDINAKGGLLGRPVDLILEDSATNDAVAAARAATLVEEDHVDVILGEGQDLDPLLFCTGPVPAQQVDPFIPWLMRETGAKTFYLPSADYIWPHTMNQKVREVVTAQGGSIVGEDYFPREDPLERRPGRVQHDRVVCTYFDENF